MTTNTTHKTPRASNAYVAARNPTAMLGISRSPLQQAKANAENALRALDMAPRAPCDLCPHPADIVRAELLNTLRYLALAVYHDSGV